MEKSVKIANATELQEQIKDVPGLILVEYSGLTVEAADDLRNKMRDAGCTYRVYKNSTIRFAVEGTSHAPLAALCKGVTGLAFNAEDPGAPARVARDFAKDNDKLSTKGGVMEGDLLDPASCAILADMPGPRELKAKLLMLFKTPATRMVQLVQAGPRDFLRVLNAKKDKDAA